MSNGSSRLVTNHIHDGDDAGGDGGANEFFGSVRGSLSTGNTMPSAGTGIATAGWFSGGGTPTTAIQRITYATDTANSSIRGPLSTVVQNSGTAGNPNTGWIASGSTTLTNVQTITYATDTAATSGRGPLSLSVSYSVGVGNINRITH